MSSGEGGETGCSVTSKTATCPPAESSGTATRCRLAQKPSHSPGVVRFSPLRLVKWVLRGRTVPWTWRKLELGPVAGGRAVSSRLSEGPVPATGPKSGWERPLWLWADRTGKGLTPQLPTPPCTASARGGGRRESCSPRRLCKDRWLGLETKPLVAERDTAVLLGDVRELVGEDRPLPAWERDSHRACVSEELQPGVSRLGCLRPPGKPVGGRAGGREGNASSKQWLCPTGSAEAPLP